MIMMMRLMSPSHAASVWDLHEGTEFSRGEADDYLMELHQYVSSRAARVGWTTTMPSYWRWFVAGSSSSSSGSSGGDDDGDACRLVVKFGEKDGDDNNNDEINNNNAHNYYYPSDWKLERFHPPQLLMMATTTTTTTTTTTGDAMTLLNRERIVKFIVYFTDDNNNYDNHDQNSSSRSSSIKATVTYMTRCGEQCGHYYVGFFRWVTRCSDPGECVALFDAIAADIRRLVALAEQYERDRELVHHLVRERIPLLERRVVLGGCSGGTGDTVLLAAIQRKVKMLQDDFNGFWL